MKLLISTILLSLSQTLFAFNGTITTSSAKVSDILASNATLSNFTSLLQAAQPIKDLFNQAGSNLTVFAPTSKEPQYFLLLFTSALR